MGSELPTMPEREQLAAWVAKQFPLMYGKGEDAYATEDGAKAARIAEILQTYIPTNKEMLADMRREREEQLEFDRLFADHAPTE